MAALLRLMPHPAGPAGPARSLSVTIDRDHAGLRLRYVLKADPGRLKVPTLQPACRADRLWEHTCVEAFVSVAGSPAYREFNFSPSSCWAAWDFAGYREGMAPVATDIAPMVTPDVADSHLVITAEVPDALLPGTGGALRLALAAVVEDAAGQRSYWALHHPAAQPDFHAAGSFVLTLPAVPAP